MQEVEGSSHLADAAVVARHVVEGHGLAKLVVLAKLFRLLEQVESAIDVLLLQVVNCEDIADLAKLLACACEFTRSRAEMDLLNFQEFLQDANCFNVFALNKSSHVKISFKSVDRKVWTICSYSHEAEHGWLPLKTLTRLGEDERRS